MSLSGGTALRHGQFRTSPPMALTGTPFSRAARMAPASAGAMSALPEATACTAATEPSVLTTSTFSFSAAK